MRAMHELKAPPRLDESGAVHEARLRYSELLLGRPRPRIGVRVARRLTREADGQGSRSATRIDANGAASVVTEAPGRSMVRASYVQPYGAASNVTLDGYALSYGFHTARHLPELKTPAVST